MFGTVSNAMTASELKEYILSERAFADTGYVVSAQYKQKIKALVSKAEITVLH